MRYPYATARNIFLKGLKKEEKKWMDFISQSEEMIETMEVYLKSARRLTSDNRRIYNDVIRDTKSGILRAQEELEIVRRNMDAVEKTFTITHKNN